MNVANVKLANKLIAALFLATLALAALILSLSVQSARAQGGQISVDKQLGRANPVVFVGEYLTFTIRIVNNSAFTITTLPLSDTYNAAVLGYADAAPHPDAIDPGTGRLDWNDLTATFDDLPPGRVIEVVVGFIAEHPDTAIVNRAEVHDALGSGGELEGADSDDTINEAIGGSSPVYKELLPGLTPQAGQPLTFTIFITNDGYTTMTVVPLVDFYEPAWLTFSYAIPPPDLVDAVSGVLTWTDVTSWTGDIPAHATVSVTTVFTPLAVVSNTLNQAEVSGARDWYNNDLAGGSDQVPITIIEPTPVRLLYFRVNGIAGHQVRLEWATGVEIDNFGFNLYHSQTPYLSQAKRLAFVSSQAQGGGVTYAYTDVVSTGGNWWYWLADVSTSGQESFHEPVRASVTASSYQVYLPVVLRTMFHPDLAKDSTTRTACCTDAIRPVVFKLERIDVE